jgi:hypothetical protein
MIDLWYHLLYMGCNRPNTDDVPALVQGRLSVHICRAHVHRQQAWQALGGERKAGRGFPQRATKRAAKMLARFHRLELGCTWREGERRDVCHTESQR